MPRVLLALVAGAIAGAAITHFAVDSHVLRAPEGDVGASEPAVSTVSARPAPRELPASAPAATAERASLYREAAEADGAALARLISTTAALPPSRARSNRLGVLLTRYAELDPERAVAIARELGVATATLAELHAQWAAVDPANALAALGDVADPAEATAIGLALLPALGGDEHALKQVLAALPHVAERALRIGAITELAASDPAAALDRALELDDVGASSRALDRVGTAWGRRDPRAALEQSAAIDDGNLRAPFQSAVLRAWAELDSGGVVDYVLGLDPEARQRLNATSGLFDVAALDPERILAVSGRLPGTLRGSLERTALQTLAQQDPEAAVARLATLPQRQQLQIARQSVAREYGKKNPDAALAWARANGDRESMVGVITGIAAKDPSRAFDLLSTLPPQDRSLALVNIAGSVASDQQTDFAAVADRLLSDRSETNTNAVTRLLQSWQARSPENAVDWLMTNAARVPPAAFQTASRSLAENDPAAAERRLAQIPSEGRTAWLQGIAQAYVQNDPQAGAAWVERLRGDPSYAFVASTIAQGLAGTDPPAAAALLDGVARQGGAAAQAALAGSNNVASSWARTNPLAAAEWARNFATDERSAQVLGAVTQTWGSSDFGAARAWTLGLPSGSARDAALRPLLTAGGNGVDTSLLAAFSADLPRQQALLTAAGQLAARNPNEARALIDKYVTRPELRAQAERILERGPGPVRPPGIPLF